MRLSGIACSVLLLAGTGVVAARGFDDEVGDAASRFAEQGIRGRVLTPAGVPAAGTQVVVTQGASADPLQLFLAHRAGRTSPVVATAVTADDGRFAIRIDTVDPLWDLRIVGDEFPELQRRSIRVRCGEWYEAGDLQLMPGAIVQGHVVDEATKRPIANARVYLEHETVVMVEGLAAGRVSQADFANWLRKHSK